MTVADYLPAVPCDPYPHSAAQAIMLSAADITDRPGHCRALLDLVAVLSPTGVPRQYLQQAGSLGLLHRSHKADRRGMTISPAAVDTLLGRLADASLITISVGGGAVTAHRLVMRVLREQLAHDHHLVPVAAAAAVLLADLLVPSEEAWTQPRAADELVKQITALNDHLPTGTWTTVPDRHLAKAVLALRGRALWYLNDAMTLPSHNITFANALVADSTRVLGPDHPDTLAVRNHLGEQYVSKSRRILGPDHPDALAARGTLASVYAAAGRYEEAIAVNEHQLSDRQRALGSSHPDTFTSRHNLTRTYEMAGQREEAVRRYQQILADCTEALGPHHPVTRAVRQSLDSPRDSAHDPYIRRRNRPS